MVSNVIDNVIGSMSKHTTSIPTPRSKIRSPFDCSDDCTSAASNKPNNKTELTQLSTDDEIITSENEAVGSNVLTGICIPQHMLPWGGRSTNKNSETWNRRVAARATKKVWKEARNS